MGSKTATANRNRERAANTEALMKNIMAPGAGEISKAREAELQRAANAGRGVQYLAPNPYVKGLTQKGGQPVLNPNGSFTGRIVANQPTLGEVGGDIMRGLFGGQAKTPSYINSPTTASGTPTSTFRQYTPEPEAVQGLIPAVAEKFLVPGGIAMGIAKDLFQKFFPVVQAAEEEQTTPTPITGFAPEGFTFPTNIQRERGPTVDLRTPTIEEQVTTTVGESGDVTSGRPDMNIPVFLANYQSGRPDMNIPVSIADYQTLDQLPNEGSYVAQPSYTSEEDTMGFYNHLVENKGKSPEEAVAIIKDLNLPGSESFANGGLTGTVPPKQGPMSEGVASLFKNK